MKLTKDEARILCAALDDYKYDIVNNSHFRDLPLMGKLNDLQKKFLEMTIVLEEPPRKIGQIY